MIIKENDSTTRCSHTLVCSQGMVLRHRVFVELITALVYRVKTTVV